MQRARVVVVDEHPAVRQGLVRLLAAQPDIEMVDEAASPEAAVEVVAAGAPTVVVLDVLMQPPGSGTALVRRFTRPPVAAKVLALAPQDEPGLAQVVAKAGAAQLLPMSVDLETLAATVRRLAGSEEPAMDRCEPRGTRVGPAEAPSSARARLLRHLAAGLSNRTIAQLEGVSERTIKRRISQLYSKLGASHRAGAVATAMQLGLI